MVLYGNILKRTGLCLRFLLLIICVLTGIRSLAAGYASSSLLSTGKWVKIGVTRTGVHYLTNQQMSSMGFSNPSEVYVFGYGGDRLPDVLSPDTYIDDLPPVPVYRTSQGLFFFARGPESYYTDIAGHELIAPNPYTTHGYYFLSDTKGIENDQLPETGSKVSGQGSLADSFTQVLQHELDAYSPGETGSYLVGEDLKYTPSRSFGFEITDNTGDEITVGASLMTNLISGGAWTMDAAGVTKDVAAPATESNSHRHGNATTSWMSVPSTADNSLNVKISLSGGSSNVRAAHVDWVAVNYQRLIRVPDQGSLFFATSAKNLKIAGAGENTVTWDVTDPTDIKKVAVDLAGGNATFASGYNGVRRYVTFNPANVTGFPTPTYVGEVANQNLHSSSGADFIIFTTTQAENAARKLAAFRQSSSGLSVEVLNQNQVYNEFSSGVPDINGLRKYLKMLYDRSAGGSATKPSYVLLMGRATFDNRHLSPGNINLAFETLPTWQTDDGLDDNTTYQTDDILGFLDDYSGSSFGADTLAVAIGRIPATTSANAAIFVDKIIDYETKSPAGAWRSKAVYIADDDDNSVHMKQTEEAIEAMEAPDGTNRMLIEKIYIDAYDYINGVAEDARLELNRQLTEGALWVNYIGHASTTQLSGEGILKYSDMGSLLLKKLPFFCAETCDFMRWDATEVSGAEMLAATVGGGVIGVISASRPVYIAQNAYLSRQIGRSMVERDAKGLNLTIGEILQRAKNRVPNNENKLRYGLLGDPSMRLLLPEKEIVIDSIAGKPFPDDEEQHILQARQDLTITGYIVDPVTGEVDTSFNGNVTSTMYDAMLSVTTQGHGPTGEPFNFEKHGMRIFAGTDSVSNGRFTVHVAMPAEVTDNFTPATLLLYANQKDNNDASAIENRFYVYGTDENAASDTIAPEINAIYLNHPSFVNGSIVNSSPTLIAEISDNHAINMSLAGIGHWMSLTLDGIHTYADVSNYYEPASLRNGTLYYPLSNLEDGAHTLTLRVWDASGNSASSSVDFYVDKTAPIQVYDIYVDHSPASETASFYLVHDRPDAELKVEFMVYDLMGRAVWINTTTGQADRYTSFPITWNLTDRGGRRVQRGIYLYRAVVTEMGGTEFKGSQAATPTKKLAVTSR